VRACSFAQDVVASVLLDRLIALDPELGTRIDGSVGRRAFITYFIERGVPNAIAVGPWKGYVMAEVSHALKDADLPAFVRGLEREPWLLGDEHVDFQNALIGTASFNVARDDFIVALLDRNPAILRRQPPPTSPAISYALTYANARLIPLLTRIWPLPDDLAHAAGMGNLARVKQWFDESGAPALGDLQRQYPCNDPHAQANDDLRWGAPTVQHVLDTAFAFAVINRHYDVADFLLEHGANINTNWNSHEPASILHHLVFLPNSYEPMRYLIDRGIDMTIKDYRWDSTAQGWARYGNKDETMAQWLAEAERQQEVRRR